MRQLEARFFTVIQIQNAGRRRKVNVLLVDVGDEIALIVPTRRKRRVQPVDDNIPIDANCLWFRIIFVCCGNERMRRCV